MRGLGHTARVHEGEWGHTTRVREWSETIQQEFMRGSGVTARVREWSEGMQQGYMRGVGSYSKST